MRSNEVYNKSKKESVRFKENLAILLFSFVVAVLYLLVYNNSIFETIVIFLLLSVSIKVFVGRVAQW